jgi:hypothetical protein
MYRPGEPFIKDHSKITGVIDPFDWLGMRLTVLAKSRAEFFETMLSSVLYCALSLVSGYFQMLFVSFSKARDGSMKSRSLRFA